MPRKLKPEIVERARPLVLQRGLKGGALAQALGVDGRTARKYAERVREEAGGASSNGQVQTPPVGEPVMVPLAQIRLDGETQARARLDPGTVAEYVEVMSDAGPAAFPPIIVFHDGEQHWLADGFHRVEAARQVGFHAIRAEVHDGGRREACLFACSANTSHGLRRSSADKRRAVLLLLEDEQWRRWSNNRIAKHCAVSLDLVNRLRDALNDSLSDDGQRTYLREGREQTMNVTRIGARAATEEASEDEAEPPNMGPADLLRDERAQEATPAPVKGEPAEDIPTQRAPGSEPEPDDDHDNAWQEEVQAVANGHQSTRAEGRWVDPLVKVHSALSLALDGFDSHSDAAAMLRTWPPERWQQFDERVDTVGALWQRFLTAYRALRETVLPPEAEDGPEGRADG